MDTLLKQILEERIYKDIVRDGIIMELNINDIRRSKVGELSKMEYKNLIQRLKSGKKLSIKSIEYIKIVRHKEKNRLSSQKYNNKQTRNKDRLTEEIKDLERRRDEFKREKMALTREISQLVGITTHISVRFIM